VRDRLSFTRFVRFSIEDQIPDGTTLGKKANASAEFGGEGLHCALGQMIDATIVPVPKQRNNRKENETVKAGRNRCRQMSQKHTIGRLFAP
jgi:transposase, IS5 family